MKSLSNQRLGEALRAARYAKGLTTRQIGAGVGISHPQVSKIEAGRFAVPPEKLRAFAEVLDLKPDDLFALAGYPVAGQPALAPYLRSRYGAELPEQAIDQITEYFELLRRKHTIERGEDELSGSHGGPR
ncbi:MAG: helix-turn-helix domain-containing protein [Frankiaceae bacterium]